MKGSTRLAAGMLECSVCRDLAVGYMGVQCVKMWAIYSRSMGAVWNGLRLDTSWMALACIFLYVHDTVIKS